MTTVMEDNLLDHIFPIEDHFIQFTDLTGFLEDHFILSLDFHSDFSEDFSDHTNVA